MIKKVHSKLNLSKFHTFEVFTFSSNCTILDVVVGKKMKKFALGRSGKNSNLEKIQTLAFIWEITFLYKNPFYKNREAVFDREIFI